MYFFLKKFTDLKRNNDLQRADKFPEYLGNNNALKIIKTLLFSFLNKYFYYRVISFKY